MNSELETAMKKMNRELKTAIYEQLLIYKTEAPTDAVEKFTSMPCSNLSMCHFGLGLYIRNNYLSNESKLHELFVADGISHEDDMSAIMIRMWHKTLNEDKNSV